MNDWRKTFNALEAAADGSAAVSGADRQLAESAVKWIGETIDSAFAGARTSRIAFKLNGSDPAERVAEALAAWIVESDPERFAGIVAAYEVSRRI